MAETQEGLVRASEADLRVAIGVLDERLMKLERVIDEWCSFNVDIADFKRNAAALERVIQEMRVESVKRSDVPS